MKVVPKRNTDQWNADDFAVGSRVFTIAGVREGTKEGPYDIDLVEGEGKCWRPPNTVIQLLNDVWGTEESDDFIGRRVELYRDATVKVGRDVKGGIRVRAVSHITAPVESLIQVTRGRRELFRVLPLPDVPARTQPDLKPHLDAIKDAGTMDALAGAWEDIKRAGLSNHPDLITAKDKRKGEMG